MSKKRGLGRGLSDMGLAELLGELQDTPSISAQTTTSSPNDSLKYLSIELIKPGRYQPRRHFDESALQELADSIRAQGIIQPLVVRPIEHNHYEIIAGERRWRAAQRAGLHQVPALIRKVADETAMAIALIENIQRKDLNAIEEAMALERLLHEFNMTHQEIAEAVGKSRTAVTNLLRLLNLHDEVKDLVQQGLLEMGHARALLPLDLLEQSKVAHEVVARALSVRETERLIKHYQQPDVSGSADSPKKAPLDPNIKKLQRQLSDELNADVVIQHGAGNKGKLIIHYHNLDTLDGILLRILKAEE